MWPANKRTIIPGARPFGPLPMGIEKNRKFRMLRGCHLTQVPRANAVVAIAAVLATAVQHRAREYGARIAQAVPEQTSHDVILLTLQVYRHALLTNIRMPTCEEGEEQQWRVEETGGRRADRLTGSNTQQHGQQAAVD
jgi:hypothetical protein